MPRSFLDIILYICILLDFHYAFSIFNMVLSLVSSSIYTMFWHEEHMAFYGFADGACCHTLNLSSAAWILYSPAEYLVSSGEVCIGPATNNIVEYRAVVALLTEAASQDVHNLVVLIDSQLVVCHLNHVYTIRNLVLLRFF